MTDRIVFVDEQDNVIGAGTRQEAVEKGIRHRIVRVYLMNSEGKLLLQKRSQKISLPGMWDHSAAGHVDEGDDYLSAAMKELVEEIGVSGVELQEVAKFYSAHGEPDLPTKMCFNMIFKAVYDGPITMSEAEVAEIKWVTIDELKRWLAERPNDFPKGFRIASEIFLKSL
jgi:isopentenyl-diphosphate delta-isomerase type 1